MIFSKASEYGLRATIYIAQSSLKGQRLSSIEISDQINVPQAFISKILQTLVKAGILESFKGPHGGFEIPITRINDLNLIDVVKAIDGDGMLTVCVLGFKNCSSSHPCPLHDEFVGIRSSMIEKLSKTRIQNLMDKLDSDTIFLKE